MFRIHVGQDSNCWSNGGRWVRIQGSVCRHAILDEDSECGPEIRAGKCTACRNALIMFTIVLTTLAIGIDEKSVFVKPVNILLKVFRLVIFASELEAN